MKNEHEIKTNSLSKNKLIKGVKAHCFDKSAYCLLLHLHRLYPTNIISIQCFAFPRKSYSLMHSESA